MRYRTPGERLWDQVSDVFQREFTERVTNGHDPAEELMEKIDEVMKTTLTELVDRITVSKLFDAIDELGETATSLRVAVDERDGECRRVLATGASAAHLDALRDLVEERAELLRLAAVEVAMLAENGEWLPA